MKSTPPFLHDEAWAGALRDDDTGEVDNLPKYKKMQRRLTRFIEAGSLPGGTPLPPLPQLAAMAGVSLRTADKAVAELIREGLCVRKPKKGTFVASSHPAVRYDDSRRKAFILYTPDGPDAFRSNILIMQVTAGIRHALEEEHIDFLTAFHSLEDMAAFYRDDPRLALLGVAIVGEIEAGRLTRLAGLFPRLPFVVVNFRPPGIENTPPNVYGIFNDDYAGAYHMTQYLLERGCRRIGLFTYQLPLHDRVYHDRVDGYRQALANHGVAARPEWVREARSDTSTIDDCGPALCPPLFAADPEVDAIFCVCDQTVPLTREWLDRHGRTEVIVTGYDYLFPELVRAGGFSTMAIPFAGMGEQTVRFFAGKLPGMPKICRLQPQFIPALRP